MSKQNQFTVICENESTHELRLRVISKVLCLNNSELAIDSVWHVDKDKKHVEHVETCTRFGDFTLDVGYNETPISHLEGVREWVQNLCNFEIEDSTIRKTVPKQKTVFLATGKRGARVFIDKMSAIYWIGNKTKVREVSVEAAAHAFKTDNESILLSAFNSSASTLNNITLALNLISLGENLKSHFNSIGVTLLEVKIELKKWVQTFLG